MVIPARVLHNWDLEPKKVRKVFRCFEGGMRSIYISHRLLSFVLVVLVCKPDVRSVG